MVVDLEEYKDGIDKGLFQRPRGQKSEYKLFLGGTKTFLEH